MVYLGQFTANLDANKLLFDLQYISDPIVHTFSVKIHNQSTVTLYFQITDNIDNWSVTSPSEGKLGSVGAGGTTHFKVEMQRAEPVGEVTESGNLTIEAFTDSEYSNSVGSSNLAVEMRCEDLENWTDVTTYEFGDGNDEGWSDGTVTDEVAIDVDGYSYRSAETARGGKEWEEISKSISLPNRNKVRLSFYIVVRGRNDYSYSDQHAYIRAIEILVDSTKVFEIPEDSIAHVTWSGSGNHYSTPWLKVTAYLDTYKNQTKTITIRCYLEAQRDGAAYEPWASFIVDRIVVAGKD